VIVGAGPAGSTCAYFLAKRGIQVLLVEKESFPRYKVCGACLHPQTVHLISEIEPSILEFARPVLSISLFCGTKRIDLPSAGGSILSRERLDSLLLAKAIQAGAEVLMATTLKVEAHLDSHYVLSLKGEETRQIETKVLVDAAGLGGIFRGANDKVASRSFIGVGTVFKPKHISTPNAISTDSISMHIMKSGYFGTCTLEDGSINVAAAVSAKGFKLPLESVVRESMHIPLSQSLEWRGTKHLTRLGTKALPRYFAIGDAAGYVEPFTGEGIKWAVLGGGKVIPAILKTLQGDEREGMILWKTEYANTIQRDKNFCVGLRYLLRTPIGVVQPLMMHAPYLTSKCLSLISRGSLPWVL